MIIQSTQELRALTGNYYANNDFEKIKGDIEQATEELANVVGQAVIELAEEVAGTEEPGEQERELLIRVQRPIALLATLRMYQKNDLSHEDDGRKFKVSTDGGEKLPWEWQLDRDDALHLEEYYRAADALVRYLNRTKNEAWTGTEQYRLASRLIIRSGADFDRYFPIEKSERMYLLLLPFIQEVQRLTVERAYGEGWELLLEEQEQPESGAHFAACMAVALLAMSKALRRLPLRLFPGGVIRGYMTKNGMRESQVASTDDIVRVSSWMSDDAKDWIEEMKQARDGSMPEYELLPRNHRRNKYCRL